MREAAARRAAAVAAVVAAAAAEQVAHAAVDVAPDLVEIGRPAATVVPALAPLGIVERHRVTSGKVDANKKMWAAPSRQPAANRHSSLRFGGPLPCSARGVGAGGKTLGERGQEIVAPGAGQGAQANGRNGTTGVALDPGGKPVRSILFTTRMRGHVGGADLGQHRRPRRRSCTSRSCELPSITCRRRSASAASVSVERNAATRSCGRSRMKPTVSDSTIGCRAGHVDLAQRGVERGEELVGGERACAPVSRLKSVDLPALV